MRTEKRFVLKNEKKKKNKKLKTVSGDSKSFLNYHNLASPREHGLDDL